MSKTIALTEAIRDNLGNAITEITLRRPAYADFFEIGFPVVWVQIGCGGYEQETPAIVAAWIARLCDCAAETLEQLNLTDTLALRDAIVDLFPPRREIAGAATAPLSALEKFSATLH
jgi:hypothetical protein